MFSLSSVPANRLFVRICDCLICRPAPKRILQLNGERRSSLLFEVLWDEGGGVRWGTGVSNGLPWIMVLFECIFVVIILDSILHFQVTVCLW